MKKILLVEDDKLVAGIYQRKLAEAGFEVTVAEDGLAAMKQLLVLLPDLVVLDLLMPKLSGVDVLRFIRQQRELASTRVIVFSNAFLSRLGEEVTAIGVDEMVVKSAVTPASLVETIHRILQSPAAPRAESHPAPPAASPTPSAPPAPTSAKTAAPAMKAPATGPGRKDSAPAFRARLHRDFFEQIPAISKGLHDACGEFLNARNASSELQQLELLRRKVGFLTHMTGMAGCHRIAQLSSAFEALLFELQETRTAVADSPRRTIAATVAFLVDCLSRADQADEQCLSPTTVLVVDDDVVSTRALLLSLGRADLESAGVTEPARALETLRTHSYDVVLLDLNLPGMDGITVRQRMRELPLHRQTPVIFITSYADFAARARSALGKHDDLIAKPIMPVELVVKVITHVLKRRLSTEAA